VTAENAAVLALARARQHVAEPNESHALIYARLGLRQQQLFAHAAKINPDYFGVCANAALTDGAVNLADIADPVPTPDLITRMEVLEPGESLLEPGAEIHTVPLNDPNGAFPPRVTLRNHVIRSVGADLMGVGSIRIYYSRLPHPIPPAGRDVVLEMPGEHWMLLVLDAERDLYHRSVPEGADRAGLVERVTAEEAPMLAAWEAHVAGYAGNMQARFASQTGQAIP
jgi:hypothetical protein